MHSGEEMVMSPARSLAMVVGALLVGMPPATAHADSYHIESVVYWTGPSCIPVLSPQYPDGRYTSTISICGGYSSAQYFAIDGEWVGANPMPNDSTVTLGCKLYLDGSYVYGDYAPSGDRHDVNCLRYIPALTNAQQRGA